MSTDRERFGLAGPPPYRNTVPAVVAELRSDSERGLSEAESASRLRRCGRNELQAQTPRPAWRKFLAEFNNPLVALLVGAAAISMALWAWERNAVLPYEAFAILAIVLFNVSMSYIQKARAEQAVSALHSMTAAHVDVLRDGKRRSVLASQLVPGDLMFVEEGDIVPADARLTKSISLQMNEAALTGESFPVLKDTAAIPDEVLLGDRSNMIFSGTVVTYGRGRAVVTATGMQTEMGRIADLLETTLEQPTPLQAEIDQIGRLLGVIVAVIAVGISGTLLFVTGLTGLEAIFDILFLGIALAVAAVPEGLPAVVTLVLAIAIKRMAARNAIVRRMAAVETLGSADVIACDKTGTLTRNEMMVRQVVTASGSVSLDGSGYDPTGETRSDIDGRLEGQLRAEFVRTLIASDRASNAVLLEQGASLTARGDPTEVALLVAARKAGVDAGKLDARFERAGEVPFSSERKRMSTVHADRERQDALRVFTKGAPEVVLERCAYELVGEGVRPLTAERRADILSANERLTHEALRTLGVAFRTLPTVAAQPIDHAIEQELVFLGLIGMIDPPRDGVRESVARALAAGIRVIMITGDHPSTAAVIAGELGIAHEKRALSGADIEALTDQELAETVLRVSVYGRVSPQHKLRIVTALQRNGKIVAVTGDGVNDAPALKAADIGVAMGISGTSVSRQAADMVLADDNFSTIVAAVEDGRAIYANIRKFLFYLLSSNAGEVMTMFFGVLLAPVIGLSSGGTFSLPLQATQILWINLLTDGAPALALGVEPAATTVMKAPPRARDAAVVTPAMGRDILLVGTIMAFGSLAVLDATLPGGLLDGTGSLAYGQTMTFTTLVLFQMFNVFNARSETQSAFASPFVNRWLWMAVGLSIGLQVAVIYVPFLQEAFATVPLSGRDWLVCAAAASSVLWLRELSKLVARYRK